MATLVIGLGNPGGEYAGSRHNMGWMCLDALERMGKFARAKREGASMVATGTVEGFDLILARPQTYMNKSGSAGVQLVQRFGIPVSDVIVAHDDLDLRLGQLRLRRGGSAGGQNGVKSLIDAWRTQDFIRVRMGIGRPDDKSAVIDYVLDRFRPDERDAAGILAQAAAQAIVVAVREGLDAAMTAFNRNHVL